MKFKILERFVRSKTGDSQDCEDAIHVNPNFIAVIDGATDKSPIQWNGETRGHTVAHLLDDALTRLPGTSDVNQTIEHLNKEIRKEYCRLNVEESVQHHPTERLTASVAIFSVHFREIWLIGDCQARIGERQIQYKKTIDDMIATARAAYLKLMLANGKKVEELRNPDPGREFILPLLQLQSILQNNPSAGDLWYPVIDGFPVHQDGVHRIPVPAESDTVILATDGYPAPRENLEQSEQELERILSVDPLLIHEYRSTKGPLSSGESFDDRSFIKIQLVD